MSAFEGGPAFPCPNHASELVESTGMTLRDYFAAKAMQGLMAAGGAVNAGREVNVAQWSYLMADAMLKERDK